MTTAKRSIPGDWYTPYFAPTTVIIAITVLVVSIEAGKYTGNYFIERDKDAQAAQATTVTVTHAAPAAAAHPTSVRPRQTSAKPHHA
jgi:hypothetical protein